MSRERFGRGLLSTGFKFSPVELEVSAWVVGRVGTGQQAGRGEIGGLHCDRSTLFCKESGVRGRGRPCKQTSFAAFRANFDFVWAGEEGVVWLNHGLLGEAGPRFSSPPIGVGGGLVGW